MYALKTLYCFSGNFRSAAHTDCNLAYQNDLKRIPIIFHNSTGFDNHFLLLAASELHLENISIIAKTAERYISITIRESGYAFVINDSFAHLPASLDTLAKSLSATPLLDATGLFDIT